MRHRTVVRAHIHTYRNCVPVWNRSHQYVMAMNISRAQSLSGTPPPAIPSLSLYDLLSVKNQYIRLLSYYYSQRVEF